MRPALVFGFLSIALLAPTSVYAQEAQERPEANELPPVEQKQAAPEGVFVPVSIMGGLRVGGAFNFGKNAPDGVGTNPNGAVGGIDLALEVGTIVWDHIYGGIIGGGTLFISPPDTKANVSSFLVGTEFGWLTNSHGLGAYFGLGVGYRAIFVTDALGGANKVDGIEGLATVALHVRIGELVRVLPRIDFGIGPNNGASNVNAILTAGFSIWLNYDIHQKKKHRHPDSRSESTSSPKIAESDLQDWELEGRALEHE